MGDYSKIENFLDQYLLDNGILTSGDDQKLEHFMQELGKYVDQLSYLPDNGGDKLILYSGSYGENMWRYAEAASETGEGFYFISNTEAGRMINAPQISRKIMDICGGDTELVARIYGNSTANGRSPYTVGNQLSINDRISANLASQASGNVTIWAPNGEPGKVLSDTELRYVLTNDRITSINGVSKTQLMDHYKSMSKDFTCTFDDPAALDQHAVNSVFDQIKRSRPEAYFDEAVVHYGQRLASNGTMELKITGIDMRKLIGGEFHIDASLSEFSATAKELARHADDDIVRVRFGMKDGRYIYDDFSSIDKLRAKQIELYVRDVTELKYTDITDNVLSSYLTTTGKHIDDLDRMDNIILSIGYKIGQRSDDIPKLLEAVKRYDHIAKLAKGTLEIVGIVGDLAYAGHYIAQICDAYQQGDYNKAVAILTAATAEFGTEMLVGNALTTIIAPSLIFFGGLAGGPIGGTIGAFLAGIIGFGAGGMAGSVLYEQIYEYLMGRFEQSEEMRPIIDPLVLDMLGNGFAPTTLRDGVHFDLDQNGFAEKMGWVKGDDLLLAIDKNGDQKINDGSELFGDRTRLKNGQLARNGFEALREYDTDQNGIIDAQDVDFASLLVWKDENGNGISESGELISLEEAGIVSISLNYAQSGEQTESGTTIGNVAKFIKSDGSEYQIAEYWVRNATYNTVDLNPVETAQDVMDLQNIRERGIVPSLHKAMTLDTTGNIKKMWIQFEQSQNVEERKVLIEKILWASTGADQIEAGSRGAHFDAKKLHVIESLLGRKFHGREGGNPNNNAAIRLQEIYKELIAGYYCEASGQTTLKNILPLIRVQEVNGQRSIDFSILNLMLPGLLGENATLILGDLGNYLWNFEKRGIKGFDDFRDFYRGISEEYNQSILFGAGRAVVGTEGNETLSASGAKTFIFGNGGNDTIYGGADTDIIDGGEGNDHLIGGHQNDVYLFGRGDGKDVIEDQGAYYHTWGSDQSPLDVIRFKEGIVQEDIQMHQIAGGELIIRIKDTEDRIHVKAFDSEAGRIERIEFADGNFWDYAEILEKLKEVNGTESADTLHGGASYNILKGYDGNDTIYAYDGNDTLEGGSGNDTLCGQEGDDILDGFRVIIMTVANSLRKSRVSDSLPKVETRRFKSLSIA